MLKLGRITFYNLYDVWNCFQNVATIFLFLAHILYIIFAPGAFENTVLSVFLIFGTVIISSSIRAFYNRISKWEEKWELLEIFRDTTQAVTGICAILPRVLVFFGTWNYSTFSGLIFFFLFLILAINNHPFLLHQCSITNYSDRAVLITALISFNVALLIASCRLATALSSGWHMVGIIATQIIFSPILTIVSIDGAMYLLNEFTWRNAPQPIVEQEAPAQDPEVPVVPEAQDPEAPDAQVENGGEHAQAEGGEVENVAPEAAEGNLAAEGVEAVQVEIVVPEAAAAAPEAVKPVAPVELSSSQCPKCTLHYSPDNQPRVLKECGHTVCTPCATKLLNNHHNHYLFCPTCRMITVVEGDVSRMPMNHALVAILEQINETK